MTPEDFSTVLRQRPFRPFTLHVGVLTSFYIGSPDQVCHKPASDVVAVLLPDGTGADLISLAHVPMLSFRVGREEDDLNKLLQNFVD
jgi:hypothetical protein